MSKDIKNFITWIRTFLDDVYAPKGQGGGITLDDVYPVGSIYISVDNSQTPSQRFGGTWVQLTETFLYASTTADTTATTAPTGQGEATHTLTVNEMPEHTHSNDWAIYNQGSDVSTSANSVNWSRHGNIKVNGVANAGGNQAHNNMPPYMKVYMWKRTA